MAGLRMHLLGSVRVKLDAKEIDVKPRKALALLIYLAVTAEHHSRDALATLLWPNSNQRRARHSLRSRLSELNKILGSGWIEADRESVGLRAGYWIDVAQFQQHLSAETGDLQHLIAASKLYRDDFLAGFTLSDSPEFDDWQFFQAESMRQNQATALEQLATTLGGQDDYEAAVPYARRWLALDTMHEAAHRLLMQLYAQSGQQAAALRQYENCRQVLAQELNLPPSDETTLLYEAIRSGEVKDAPTSPTPQRRHNLPTQTSTFIGRDNELGDIERLLLEEPGCRLLNLVGPGGIGKTRLSLAAAARTLDSFADGSYIVSLAPVGEVVYVVPAIAEALNFSFFGNIEPREQLLDFLSQRSLLLVVDNFEHLLEEAGLLSEILARAPDVVILATSRERLNLLEEWVYDVRGLSYPADGSETLRSISEYSAVELFTQRARQIVSDFDPSPADMINIIRICQLVEGMPLALELAAPWIRTLSCHEIAEEIDRSLDFLTTRLRNVEERHQSVNVVFDQTWNRLSDDEQTVLKRLSVFRGGCTREAAMQVTGATLAVLSSLTDKALIRRTNTGRYAIHELIRQFAQARLEMSREAYDQAWKQHRDYFLQFLEARAEGIKGKRQTETLDEVETDIDNVRLAWYETVAVANTIANKRCAECLFVYYLYRNGYDEGIREFRRAVAAYAVQLTNLDDDDWSLDLRVPDQQTHWVGFLLACQGYFVAHRRNLPRGQQLLENALALLRRKPPEDPWLIAFAMMWLGWAYYFQGQLEDGKRLARESLALFRRTSDRWASAWTLLLLGACLREARPAEAKTVYESGFRDCRVTGDQVSLSYLSFNHGVTNLALGKYLQAQESIDLGVRISERLNNVLGLGYSLLRRGQLQIAQGKYQHAVDTLRQSWTHFSKVGTVHASRALHSLGTAHHLQSEYEVADRLYRQAIDGFHAANNELEAKRCLSSLGWLAYDQGRLDEAEQLQQKSLEYLQAIDPNSALVAIPLRFLAQVMYARGANARLEAAAYSRRALQLSVQHQLAPLVLDIFLDVVLLNEIESPTALLILVERHEASAFNTRIAAQNQLAQLPPHRIREVEEDGRTPDLWTTAQLVLTELARLTHVSTA